MGFAGAVRGATEKEGRRGSPFTRRRRKATRGVRVTRPAGVCADAPRCTLAGSGAGGGRMVPVSSAGGFSVANPALEGFSSSLEARGA